MVTHRVDWRTAPPLWTAALAGETDLKRPEILRFRGDDFMDQLQRQVAAEKPDLSGYVAAPETWRDEEEDAVGLNALAAAAGETLKLYQPAHGRFYLVAGGLVCKKYGMPDKGIETSAGESAFFVLRRLEPAGSADVDPSQPLTYNEFGWELNGTGAGWRHAAATTVKTAEERLPLFPLQYANGDGHRRILAGLVPAGARERYETALPEVVPDPADADGMAALSDDRLAELDAIIAGLQALLGAIDLETAPAVTELREALFFSLLDLGDYLDALDSAARSQVEGVLTAATFEQVIGPDVTWLAAVDTAQSHRAAVEAGGTPGAPVSSLSTAEIQAAIGFLGVASVDSAGEPLAAFDTDFFDDVAPLPALPPPPPPPPDAPPQASAVAGTVYVVRFGYERPNCRPSEQFTISPPSRPFELSSFFDADAPVRPLRIDLPFDTSPAGLRKFPKGVSVALSKQLREQVERIQAVKLEDLDSGDIPGEGGGLDFGMICSLSIPIITICALILLMIIVSLLNIVFWWLPLFKICRPKV